MRQNILLIFLSGIAFRCPATDIIIKNDSLQIRNAFYERQFVFDKKEFHTVSYKDLITNSEYSDSSSKEFSFSINNKEVNGNNYFFKYAGYTKENISATDQLIKITLKGIRPISAGITVTLLYYVYDELPAIRKGMAIKNNSGKKISITNLDIESLDLMVVSQYMTEIYSNYGTNLHRIPYNGDYYDPALLVWSVDRHAGFILGNEAPSVLKKTNVHAMGHQISIGMKHNNEEYPFKKILANGEVLNSPKTFISFYNGGNWQDAFEGYFAKFIGTKIGFRLAERSKGWFSIKSISSSLESITTRPTGGLVAATSSPW